MASKFGMAGGMPERRVRPVWDAIDSRQFKNALKLSTSLLSKYPNSPYALALKALILERMGKSDEALSVCINAKELLYKNDLISIDDLTLSTLQIVFQRLDHFDMATSCYEYECGKSPNNLELMMGLFNCYVREYSFVKQQQIAIKMYKIGGEERFLLWAVCSIQLQVFCGSGGEKLLQLAEGLLKKHIASHSLHEPEALSVYISLLEQQAKYEDALEIISGKLGSLIMIEVDKLRIQVILVQLQIFSKKYWNYDLEGFAVQMTEMYGQNLSLSKDLDVQESMFGEELLSMTCNILVQLFWRTSHVGYLLEAIMVLELGLAIRRHVWQYKILLVHLYSHLSTLPLAYERYKSLDVKNILLETVSHHILPQMLTSPLWGDNNDLLNSYLKFMDEYFRESADLTFLAYRHRNYSKVIEFVQFKERLQRSSQYLMAKVEGPILNLKWNSNSIEDEEQREVNQTEANVTKTIERRSLLPRLIYLSIQSASSSLKDNGESNNSGSKVSLELKALLDRYANILGFPFKDVVELVSSVLCGQKTLEVFVSNLTDWMNFAVFLNAYNFTSNKLNNTFPITWQSLSSFLNQCISNTIGSTKPVLSSSGNNLSVLMQLVTEPLSWHGLILRSHVRSALPSGKKKKKSGPGPTNHSVSSVNSNSKLSHEIKESISSLFATIEQVSQWLKQQIDTSIETNIDTMLSFLETKEDDNDSGPGKILKIIENLGSNVDNIEVGDRICRAIRSWRPSDGARKLVTSQGTVLREFSKICESKKKALQALKLQV